MAQAKERFERGLALAQAGNRWDAALAEFLASRDIYPTRSATRNAAIALKQLARYVEAIELYELMLTELPSMGLDGVDSAKQEMTALLQQVGELELSSNEAGATLVVDGRQRGVTPLRAPILLDPGTHTLRLSKEGFETFELQITIAARTKKEAAAPLRRLAAIGTLLVVEETGRVVDVVVDSAVVGKTPWRGSLAPGHYSVLLRDGTSGTPPSSAEIVSGQAAALTLRAVELDAELRISPTPSSATVFIDGVSVGNGVWSGKLQSGSRRIEVVAPEHFPFRRTVQLRRSQREVLQVNLDRDTSKPLFGASRRSEWYAEAALGGLIAPSLGGGADENCNCDERRIPLGALGALRLGYSPVAGWGIEVAGGYLTIAEHMTRRMTAVGGQFVSQDYEDATRLSGPLAAVGLSYRMFEKFPVTGRVAFGLAWLGSTTSNTGSYSGSVVNRDTNEMKVVTGRMGAAEMGERLLAPFAAAEARIGYRFSKSFSADLGLGMMLLWPPSVDRRGAMTFDGVSDDERRGMLDDPDDAWSTAEPVKPLILKLPRESITGSFVAFTPQVAARWEF